MEEQLLGQMNLFDCFGTEYKITKPIRLIELFAGIGSQAMALRDIGAKFEHYKVVEFDKYAIASYNAVHGTDFPTIDITKFHGEDLEIKDKLDYTYLLTYSFPCTDLSVAGKMLGMAEGSGTRSSLLWEVRRLLEECGDNLPQVLMMENVPQVHSKANMPHFQKWLDYLSSKGYSSFWQDLNAKNYGVAQSRNRCFVISILGDYTYKFPEPFPLEKRMKDYLEESVNEKFYVISDKARELIDKLIKGGKLELDRDYGTTHFPHGWLKANADYSEVSPTIDAGISMQHTLLVENQNLEVSKLGFIDKGTGEHQSNMVYRSNGISPCMNAVDYKAPTKILEVVALDEQNKCFRNETFGTLTTDGSSPKHNNRVVEVKKIGGGTRK